MTRPGVAQAMAWQPEELTDLGAEWDAAAGRAHPGLDRRAQSAHVSGGAPGSLQVGEDRAGEAVDSGYRHGRELAGRPRDAVGEPAQRRGVEAHGFGHG